MPISGSISINTCAPPNTKKLKRRPPIALKAAPGPRWKGVNGIRRRRVSADVEEEKEDGDCKGRQSRHLDQGCSPPRGLIEIAESGVGEAAQRQQSPDRPADGPP